MSTSIKIPKSSRTASSPFHPPNASSYSTSSTSSSSSPYTSSPLNPNDKGKGKAKMPIEDESSRWATSPFRRRASLMGAELSKTEHIVVNVGSTESPRLISCVSSSQGFDWNRSIFLPRYITGIEDDTLEHRQDPIEDVVVTDEEARDLLPQW